MSAYRLFVSVALIVVPPVGLAQVVPPMRAAAAPVLDHAMVLMDGTNRIEVIPGLRAVPEVQSNGRAVLYRIVSATKGDPISSTSLGVAVNHTAERRGLITGEIAFKMRGQARPADLDPVQFPKVSKVVEPDVYEVVVGSPAEFVATFNRLKARDDLEWVEPFVIYGPTVTK